MNQQRQDVIRIIIVLLSIGTQITKAQPFPDTEGFNQNDINNVAVKQNTSISKTEQTNDGSYLDILTGICREGWVKGRVNDVTVCLKTNTELLPWNDARDTCRSDFSFLVKMEAPVKIESMNLEDYLKKKNIKKIWTGLHEEGGYLVWDEVSPHKVRAYNDPLEEELLQRRAWKWDIEPFDSDEMDDAEDFEFQEESHSTCGTLDVNTYSDPHHVISKRAVQSPVKDPKDIQTEDVLDTEHTPAANSKEIESPPDTSRPQSSHPAQKTLLRWIEHMKEQLNERGSVHSANEVKEYINNQRDRMGENMENEHEFTTNLNEAIEPVKPTEKTDFSIQRNEHRESKLDESYQKKSPTSPLFSSLPTNLRGTKFKQNDVTPKSIPATPASLVSVPTRPTMAVFIPLPTDPANENITSLNGKTNDSLTDSKVGLPIPTARNTENITETKENLYPEDYIDYDDLLLNEKKKISTQSSVIKPTLGTDFLRTTLMPTPPSIKEGSRLISSSSRNQVRKIKNGTLTGSVNVANESISKSSSEEDIDSMIEFVKLSETMGSKPESNESKKEETMNEILQSLVSSSEEESKEDTEEIEDLSDALENKKGPEDQQHQKQIKSKNETEIEFLNSQANKIQMPPAIEIKKSKDRLEQDSLDSSKLSDEKDAQVSETDEIIFTDEIKSESVEDLAVDTSENDKNANDTDAKNKERNVLQPEGSQADLKERGEKPGSKPISIDIGLEDSDDLKAYLEAMKPSASQKMDKKNIPIDATEDSSEEIDQKETVGSTGKIKNDLKSITLFNTKSDYDLTELDGIPKTANNVEEISEPNTDTPSKEISEEQTDKEKGDYTGEKLPPPKIDLASRPKESEKKRKNLDRNTNVMKTTDKKDKTSSKVVARNMGVAIPIMPSGDNDDSYLNEYIKAVRNAASLSETKRTEKTQTTETQAKSIPSTSSKINPRKTKIVNKPRSSSESSESSESSSIEEESDISDSSSSESISISSEEEEIGRDRKLSMNRKEGKNDNKSQSNASNEKKTQMKQATDQTRRKTIALKENEDNRFINNKKQNNNNIKVKKTDTKFPGSSQGDSSITNEYDSNSNSKTWDVESESEGISDEGTSEEFDSMEDTEEVTDTSNIKRNKEGAQISMKERKESRSKISTTVDKDDNLIEEKKDDIVISPTTVQPLKSVAGPINTNKKDNELKIAKIQKSNNIGGIIIPTQSNILFGSMTEKSNTNEKNHESRDDDLSTAPSNIKETNFGVVETDDNSVPIAKVNILSEKSVKTTETVAASKSSEESKEKATPTIKSKVQAIHSSKEPTLVASNPIDTSSTQSEETENYISPDREFEPDDAKLAFDLTDNNKIDSYSSDEESLENKSIRPTTIMPEEEDYDTSSSGEKSSEEMKGKMPEPLRYVDIASTSKSANGSLPVTKHNYDGLDSESSTQSVIETPPQENGGSDENDASLKSETDNSRISNSKEINNPLTNVNNSIEITTKLKTEKTDSPNEIKAEKKNDAEKELQRSNEISQQDNPSKDRIILPTGSPPPDDIDIKKESVKNRSKETGEKKTWEKPALPTDDDTENESMDSGEKNDRDTPENIHRSEEIKNTALEKSNIEMNIENEDENAESNSKENKESSGEYSNPKETLVHSRNIEDGSLDQKEMENQGWIKKPDSKEDRDKSLAESTDTTVSIESEERNNDVDDVDDDDDTAKHSAEEKPAILRKPANDIKTNDISTSESKDILKEVDSSAREIDDDQSKQSVEKIPKEAGIPNDLKEPDSSEDEYDKKIAHSDEHRDDSSTESASVVDKITSEVSLDKSTKVKSSEDNIHDKVLQKRIEENENSTESIEISDGVESKEKYNDQPLDSLNRKEENSNDSNENQESSKDSVEESKEVESFEDKTKDQSLELVEHKNESDINPTSQVDIASKKSKDSVKVSKDDDPFSDDQPKYFWGSEENTLARSSSYEVKDYYDENNELFNEPEDEAMYMKEVNRDKLERDKNYEIDSSQEIPIVLEAIRNIDDSRENTNILHSDEAFRSLIEKMNNKSRHLMVEAASKDEVRHQEDQDLDSTGILGGDISDDMDMDPEDILAHEADLRAEANVNEALLPRFSKSWTMKKKNPEKGKASMRLSNCYLPRTSMCYTYPVTVESTASTCDSGWVGHVYHKKCYRIMRNANTIPKMPYENAKSICAMEGGNIAQMKDGYGGQFLLMTLIKNIKEYSKELPPKDDIPPIWVSSGSSNPSCHVMTLSGPIAMGCDQSIAVAICEKNANDIDVQNGENPQTTLDIKEFMISDKKVLECDLKTSAAELPILWFKDGRLIDIKVKKRKESILPHLGGQPISPLPEPAETPVTSLELNTWLRKTLQTSTDQTISDEIFQGSYWCETWKTKPFVREKSKEIFVRFTDVITFVGKIRLPAIPYEERLLHNKIEKNLPPILNMMTDLRFINRIVFRKLQQEFPNLEKILTYPGEISSNPPLQLSFNVYIRASKNYTIADEMPLYKSMRSRYQEILRDGNILTRLPRGTPIRLIRSLNIRSTVSCQQTTLRDYGTKLVANFFPAGINLNVSSIEVCENGEKAGRATCKGNFRTGAYWGNIHINQRCATSDTIREEIDEELDELTDNEEPGEEYENLVEEMSSEERLKELAEMEIEENNLESVMEETAEITDTVEELKEIDLEYINDIMEKSAISPGKSRFVAAKALQTVDRLLDMDDTVFEKAKRVSRIIQNFEKIVENTELSEDGYFRLVLPNVAMEIYELEKYHQPVIGMAARTDQQGNVLYTPFNQQRIITIYNDSAIYDDIDVAIHLPPQLVQETRMENKSRLYMMVYREGNMFQDSSVPINVGQKVSVHDTQEPKMLNSFVISASIGGKKIEGLKQKVKTIFRPLKDLAGRSRTCAFYNFTLNNMAGGWSSAGCIYDGQVNGRDVCLCDHLTNFAVLIDFYGQEDRIDRVHEVSLSIISLIGLSLSILGLSLTIISYVFFRKLRKGRAQQTLFNLALAMLCSWVIFLVGIKQTYHYIGCLIVAILLHYFIVASFMWMLMEAFLQYLTFVKVLGTYVNRYTLKSVIAAWGLPLIPIICVLSIDHNLYKGGDHYCWMSLDAFYYAFAVPVGVIILANLVIFVITVVSIFRRPQGLRSNQSKHKMAITNLQAAITSFVLLGLSWILGYFAISDARLLFQYAFTILNSLQGFFIFVLFVARKKQVREQWRMICCCIYPDHQKTQRTLSASTSYPSTCSSRSNSSTSTLHHQGRTDRSDSCKTTTSFIGTDYDSIYTVPYSRASRDSLYYRKL